jgi:hypothetical protein
MVFLGGAVVSYEQGTPVKVIKVLSVVSELGDVRENDFPPPEFDGWEECVVLNAHKLLYHSTLGLRVMKTKKKKRIGLRVSRSRRSLQKGLRTLA